LSYPSNMKKILFIVLSIGLLLGAVLFYINDNLDSFVRTFIVKKVSEATTVDVNLDSVSIYLKEGRAEMHGFILGNPKPFDKDYAFKFTSAQITLNTDSLFKDTIIINKVLLEGAQIYYEKNQNQSNFTALTKAIHKQEKESKPLDNKGAQSIQHGKNGKDSQTKKFIIRRVELIDTLAEVAIPGLSKKSISMKIPDMLLEGIGESEGGVPPEELSRAIIQSIEKQLINSKELISLTSAIDKTLRSVDKIKQKLEKDSKEINRIESQLKKIKDLKDLF